MLVCLPPGTVTGAYPETLTAQGLGDVPMGLDLLLRALLAALRWHTLEFVEGFLTACGEFAETSLGLAVIYT